MKFTENEEDMFNDVFEVTQKGKDFLKKSSEGKVPFEDIEYYVNAYSNDTDEPIGIIRSMSRDPYDLKKYDHLNGIADLDKAKDCEGYVAVALYDDDEGNNKVFAYGGESPFGVYCKEGDSPYEFYA